MHRLEERSFLALVALVSLAFAWIIVPFFGAVLWGVVVAILFAPLNAWLLRRMPGRENVAALITLLAIIALVILPSIILGIFLVQEVTGIYARIRSGDIDFASYFRDFRHAMPDWLDIGLRRMGLTDIGSLREKLSSGFASGAQALAGQVINIGQSAFGFLMALGVMLYLTFFLLRDGDRLAVRLRRAVPLADEQRDALLAKFIAVVRATIKGSIVVAIVQGLIGGIVFWALGIHGALLWGVLMGFLSLLPAIGTGLVWVPVAIYLLASGAIWQGVVLVLCGLFVIGMVDNILRPILVGRDTSMPDYMVLVSTLGGIQIFGFNGFVIGPVIAALFLAAWDIFAHSREELMDDRLEE